MKPELHPGDLAEVRTASEILETLDPNGTLAALPFNPEMLPFCGGRYRISKRVLQADIDGEDLPGYTESYVREFRNNDVVFLENLRCSGLDHDGCRRGCRIFWKEAWLKKVDETANPPKSPSEDIERFRRQLKTSNGQGIYFCQSTEFFKATQHISFGRRLGKVFGSVRAGNCSGMEMARGLLVWCFWKSRQKLLGAYPRGDCRPTPVGVLDLQPGELVEVKPLADIVATLDKNGKNRGLHFSADMLPFIGKQYRVRSRADRMINEISGEMRGFPNTVILEGVHCDSAYYAFGGCPRNDFQYWREIWLKRVE
jgi:hypothetical protein